MTKYSSAEIDELIWGSNMICKNLRVHAKLSAQESTLWDTLRFMAGVLVFFGLIEA